MSLKTALTFSDVENDQPHTVLVEQESRGVSLYVKDHGTLDSNPAYGPVVLLEMRDGVPCVVIWADITSEEPTHVISLEKAHEKYRLPDAAEVVDLELASTSSVESLRKYQREVLARCDETFGKAD